TGPARAPRLWTTGPGLPQPSTAPPPAPDRPDLRPRPPSTASTTPTTMTGEIYPRNKLHRHGVDAARADAVRTDPATNGPGVTDWPRRPTVRQWGGAATARVTAGWPGAAAGHGARTWGRRVSARWGL